MAQVSWSQHAVEDLEAICAFIARDSEHYAALFAERVLSSVERLVEFPVSGRPVSELDNPEIREILLGNYRIIYRAQDTAVQILTVYHSARLLRLQPDDDDA